VELFVYILFTPIVYSMQFVLDKFFTFILALFFVVSEMCSDKAFPLFATDHQKIVTM